jgi:hypothetical protein
MRCNRHPTRPLQLQKSLHSVVADMKLAIREEIDPGAICNDIEGAQQDGCSARESDDPPPDLFYIRSVAGGFLRH